MNHQIKTKLLKAINQITTHKKLKTYYKNIDEKRARIKLLPTSQFQVIEGQLATLGETLAFLLLFC